jgi:hypothetical protein
MAVVVVVMSVLPPGLDFPQLFVRLRGEETAVRLSLGVRSAKAG